MSKKILAMFMAVAMAFSLLPVTALAGNPSLLSITSPDEGTFATYEFYTSKTAENPCYTQIVKTGDTLNPPADPTLAGSHFTGWKTADGKEVPFGPVTVEKASTIQCYAQWEENKNPIHVYFMAAIGSNEVMHTGVAQNGAVDIPPDYRDITWKTEKNETFDGTNVTKDMNVYPASASCWLTFDSQGGSAIASHYVPQGNAFDLKDVGNPTKTGYMFAGWSLTTDGETVGQVIPTQDTKLYACWTPATADYTVIHWQENANDDEYSYITSETKSGPTEGQTNAVANSYEGFTEQAIEQQTIKGDGSTIVNVRYSRNVYQVKFKLDKPTYTCGKEEHKHKKGIYGLGGCYDIHGNLKCGKEAHTHDNSCGKTSEIVISAKYGAYIGDQWPTIDGSSAWRTSENGNTSQVNIDTMPLNGATFYGPETGRGSESAYYYVEVLPNESGTVTRGDVTYKLHHTDTSPGTGYKVSKEDKYKLTGFTYKEGTSNGSRYDNAKFYYTRNSYDVVYISNGVEVQKNSYKYEQDIRDAGNYTPDNAPDGYTFGGWCSDSSGTTPYEFSGKTMPDQNITVYATWVPITLTLTIEDVKGVTSGTVNYNQVINRAEVYGKATTILENAGKTVLYWVTSTGERVDVNSQMTKNLTIRPVLKGDTYSVTYTSGANDSQQYWFNTIAKVKNYTGDDAGKFLYWTYEDENQYHPGAEIQMTANVTLKPNFSGENPGQTYSVTYHSNFGMDQEYTPAESIKNNDLFTIKTYEDTRLPDREDYEFKEWNTKSDGTGEKFEANSTARMNGANDNDLYARWQPCTYTLTYNANGGYFSSVENTTTTEGMTTAGKHDLLYTPAYTPNHEQTSEGKDVIFLGWSTTQKNKVFSKSDVSDATTIASSITTKVDIPSVQTVYAVWSLDENGNNFPDVFEATVTYEIKNGTWADGKDKKTEVIKVKELKNGVWVDTDNKLAHVPSTEASAVKPSSGFTATGTWDPNLDKTTPVTANKKYTYTLSPVTTGTLTITKNVAGRTLDQLDQNKFKITVKGPSDYSKDLSLTDTDVTKNESTATWTISGLPAGEYTVSESSADVKDYTYTVTYNNGTANSDTVNVEKNKTRAMTVTNTYTKNATVKLSDLIKKELTVKDGSTLPDNTKFTVTVTPKNGGTQDAIIGTTTDQWTGGIEAEGNTTYTVPFDFKTKNTLSLPAGTHTYTVQENATSPISGMQYDSDTYTLTIKVENSKASVQYTTGEGSTPIDVSKEKPLTIQNTYQTPYLSVTKQPYKVNNVDFKSGETVARVGEQIIWKVNVTNTKTTPASTQLKDTLGGVTVYSDEERTTSVDLGTDGTWTARVPANETVTYYVTYKVQAADILNGKIVNTIVKDGNNDKPINSDPVSTWDSKQLKSATSLSTSDWTTTVTLTLPTVNKATDNNTVNPVVISKGSYVIDQIGNEFTFVPELKLTLKVGDTDTTYTGEKVENKDTYNLGTKVGEEYPYTVTYTAKDGDTPAQFKWEINQDIPAGTKVTLSYKLKLTNPKTAAGTYGVEDLNGDNKTEPGKTPIYTNESAALYKDDKTKLAEFPKPSVSYTIKGSSGSHSGGSRPSLNTKDHYGYIIGYPVDYYTGQPTTDQTQKPVRPEGKITRAEVATIYFRMLTDESRTKFWSQSNSYSDVKAGDWFNNAVSTLSNAGIIAGYEDGSFRPNGYITRAEFATIAARFFDVTYNGKDLFPDISGHWAKDYINQAANKGFVNGYEDGTFKPDRNITRAEAVTLVNRTLDRHPDKSHFTKDMLVWPDNMDQTKWYYADMQEATNSHTYQMKENSDKTKYENWTKTLPIRNWEALEKAWSNANSSQGNGNVV